MTVETEPKQAFDLGYSVHDFEPGAHRDSRFLLRAIEDTMVALGAERRGRVLDVACGTGRVAMRIAGRGLSVVGAEASMEMIGVGRYVQPESRAEMVRSLAEALPFRDGLFDTVLCQGSLDHFADGEAFMREAARVAGDEGRVVIALANYDSVSCRFGRAVDRMKRRLGRARPPWRQYWEVPDDHNVKGDLRYVRTLGGRDLTLERCFGMSLFWLAPRLGALLDRLPERAACTVWDGLDRFARRRPQHADMIISVWRKTEAHPWTAD